MFIVSTLKSEHPRRLQQADNHNDMDDGILYSIQYRLVSRLFYTLLDCRVRKDENSLVFFAVGGQTNGFSQFKVDSICFPTFSHCGSFSIGPLRPLPHAKLSGTNLKIGTCRVNFSV